MTTTVVMAEADARGVFPFRRPAGGMTMPMTLPPSVLWIVQDKPIECEGCGGRGRNLFADIDCPSCHGAGQATTVEIVSEWCVECHGDGCGEQGCTSDQITHGVVTVGKAVPIYDWHSGQPAVPRLTVQGDGKVLAHAHPLASGDNITGEFGTQDPQPGQVAIPILSEVTT